MREESGDPRKAGLSWVPFALLPALPWAAGCGASHRCLDLSVFPFVTQTWEEQVR